MRCDVILVLHRFKSVSKEEQKMNEKAQCPGNTENSGDGRILNIPYETLSPETLRSIIEECVTRGGTDYGEVEVTFEQKITQVHREITSGKALILFDTKDQICNIVLRDDPRIKGIFSVE